MGVDQIPSLANNQLIKVSNQLAHNVVHNVLLLEITKTDVVIDLDFVLDDNKVGDIVVVLWKGIMVNIKSGSVGEWE